MQFTSLHPLRRIAIGAVAVLAGTTVLAACSSSGSESGKSTSPSATGTHSSTASPAADTISGTVGNLVFVDAWVRQPARPEVAAGYLTIKNNGAEDDKLVKATADVATKVVPMDEVVKNGVGTMTDIPELVVPAHGSFVLSPGHAHLMLYTTGRTLKPGDQVKLTLTFEHAGTVTLTLPVRPRSASDVPMTHMTGGMSASTTGGMSGMPGMGSSSSSPGMASMTNMSEGASGPTG